MLQLREYWKDKYDCFVNTLRISLTNIINILFYVISSLVIYRHFTICMVMSEKLLKKRILKTVK